MGSGPSDVMSKGHGAVFGGRWGRGELGDGGRER